MSNAKIWFHISAACFPANESLTHYLQIEHAGVLMRLTPFFPFFWINRYCNASCKQAWISKLRYQMSLCHQSYLFVKGTWARDPTVKITKQLSVWWLTGAHWEYSVYSTAGLASYCCCREWRCVARFMLWVVPCRSTVSILWIILNNTPGVCDGAVDSCEVAWVMCKSDSGLSHVLQPLTGPAWALLYYWCFTKSLFSFIFILYLI